MRDARTAIRPMAARDVAEAARLSRLAFGTFMQAPDLASFRRDLGTVETRFVTDPGLALVAEADGRLLGSILGMDWGSHLTLGPLSVDPALWGKGVARRLTAAFMEIPAVRAAPLVSLFTFPQSASHLRLYESFGFASQFLTPVMAKRPQAKAGARLFSALSGDAQSAALAQCRAVADAVLPGLDLSRQIETIAAQRLGETVLVESAGEIAGFALCHIGGGTEAGEGTLYVKFAATRPGAAEEFERLLDGIEALAVARGLTRITAGVNAARRDAHRRMTARGFRASLIGVAMHRPDVPGTLRADQYVIDDWR
jgi:predicted N-acetyltransferase YhbS